MKYLLQFCMLEKKTEKNTISTHSWIPQEFAVKGRCVKLKTKNGWDDHWIVKTVNPTKVDSDLIETVEKQHRIHRKTTDI